MLQEKIADGCMAGSLYTELLINIERPNKLR